MRLFARTRNGVIKALPLVCILLVLLLSIEDTSHVHPERSKLPAHSCSVCSATHSGIRIEHTYVHALVFARTESVSVGEELPHAQLVLPDLFIRPPPSA